MVTLLFWQFTILNRIHLKLSTHHRITVFWWDNWLWVTCDARQRGCYRLHVILTFYHFLFCPWIFESFKSPTKWLETLHKWPKLLSLMKKVSLEWPSHIFVLLQSLQAFTYIAFKDLLCGNCIVLAIHHIESNSFETFQASSNHCLFMRNLTLGHLWCTTERF